MKLRTLNTSGLKAFDAEIEFSDVTVVLGENGSGKTSVLDALHLLAHGTVPGIPKTADGVMRLARGSELLIEATVETESGIAEVSRSWKRARDGSVKESISQRGLGPRGGLRESKTLLAWKFGGLAEAFRPDDFLALSAAKMRARLLEIAPSAKTDVSKWVPENCPEWAVPIESDSLIDWITTALNRTKEKISEGQADVRTFEAQLENLDDGRTRTNSTADKKKLEALRHELLCIQSRTLLDEQLRTAEERLERTRLSVGPSDSHEAERLLAAVVSAAAEGLMRERRRLEGDLGVFDSQLAGIDRDLEALKNIEETTEEEASQVAVGLASANERVRFAGDRVVALQERLRLLSTECPLDHCPHCGTVLEEIWAAAREKTESEIEEARTLLEAAKDAQRIAESASTLASSGVRKAAKKALAESLEQKSQPLHDKLNELPSAKEIGSARTYADAYVGQIAESEKAASVLDDLEMEVETLRAKAHEAAELRAEAEVNAEIAALESSLEESGRRRARAEDAAETKAALTKTETRLGELKAWLAIFTEIQAKALAESKGWLEQRLSESAGALVTVELFDARENPTCRLQVDGIDVSTLSGGEHLQFLSALIIGVAGASASEWRPALIDKLESISQGNRKRFLQSLVNAVNDEQIDQAIIAGCPDNLPVVDGVTIVRLERRVSRETAQIIDLAEVMR